jgi:SAM-dependent methyltransferase
MGRTLCLGDGEGRNGVYLAQLGHDVVTVDLSPVGVVKARRLAAERGVNIDARVADLAEFDLGEGAWHNIVSVPAALRTGGCFVFEAYRAANIGRGVGGPQNADMTVELEDLLHDLGGEPRMTIDIGREVERNIVEGKYHNGMSATTQVLARKG